MKRKITLATFMLIGLGVFSQIKSSFSSKNKDKDKDNMTYTLSNDNVNINYYSVGIDPLCLQAGNTTYMGISPAGTVLYNNIFLHAEYNYHYLAFDANDAGTAVSGSSIYQPTNSNDFELLGGYYFTRVVDGKVRIDLKQKGKVNYYTNVNAKYEKFIGLEGGIERGVKLIYANGQFNAVDGYSGQNTAFNGLFSTNMTYTWLYLGGSIGKLIDVTGDFSEIGKKSNKTLNKFYVHAIFALQNQLDDIYYLSPSANGSPLYYKYQINNTVPKSNIGIRLGFNQDYFFNVMSTGAELELMPGIKGSSSTTFIRIKIQIGFNKIFNS